MYSLSSNSRVLFFPLAKKVINLLQGQWPWAYITKFFLILKRKLNP